MHYMPKIDGNKATSVERFPAHNEFKSLSSSQGKVIAVVAWVCYCQLTSGTNWKYSGKKDKNLNFYRSQNEKHLQTLK